MPQLLVRNVDESLIERQKHGAQKHGISVTEELRQDEHRQIMREALLRPPNGKLSLIEFLYSEVGEVLPELELDLARCL
jgi:plasmid stability protein